MRCVVTHSQTNKHCNVGELSHKVKCGYSVQRVRTEDECKQPDCIKARNHTFLDFPHLSRNKY